MERDFRSWYEAEQPRLYAMVLALVGDAHVANDLADEALARACERWDRVGDMESPGGWTYRTALNLVRRRARRSSLERRVTHLLRRRDDVAEALPEWSIDTLRALQALPPRMREVCSLFYVADRPVEEIAALLEISTGTVLSTLHDARRRLSASMPLSTEKEDQR
jgi:RNA polymerase sigma factor (sigma-70 family)